jgi:hypothetical protein
MPYDRILPHDARARIIQLQSFARARDRHHQSSGSAPAAADTATPVASSEYHWHRIWHFPVEAAAERWNAQWEEALECPGTSHPAFVTIDGALIRDRLLDALARVAAGILTEEVLAGSPYPFMKPGWSYQLLVRHTFYYPRRSGSVPTTIVTARGEVLDAGGELNWSTDATRQYPADVIPVAIGELWSTRRWTPTAETYA